MMVLVAIMLWGLSVLPGFLHRFSSLEIWEDDYHWEERDVEDGEESSWGSLQYLLHLLELSKYIMSAAFVVLPLRRTLVKSE